MSEETRPSTEGAPENAAATAPEPPSDFREFVKWRTTGELPEKAEEPQPAAAEPSPQAKTVPQSGAEVTQAAEDDEEEGEKPGRGSSRVRKIDRLTRENEWLKQQLASVQLKPAAPEPPKPAEAPGKPKLHDYPTLEAHLEALADWKLDQREKQKQAEAAEAEAKSRAEKLQTSFAKSQDASRSAHADYDDVVLGVKPPPMPEPVVDAIRQAMLEDESGSEVLYYLGTHPDEFSRIAAMSPASAAREIGRISATLAPPSTAAGNPKPKVSGAPRPPAPLSRPSAGTSKKDILDEDFARSDFRSWSRLREAQLKGQ